MNKAQIDNQPPKPCGVAVQRLGWTLINRNRSNMPKTGFVVAGSYRNGEWSTSSLSQGDGYPRWADDDRTHFCRLSGPLPKPPND